MTIERYADPSQLRPGRWVLEKPYSKHQVCGTRGLIAHTTDKSVMIRRAYGNDESPAYGKPSRCALDEVAFVCDTMSEAVQMQFASGQLGGHLSRDEAEMMANWKQECALQVEALVAQHCGPAKGRAGI